MIECFPLTENSPLRNHIRFPEATFWFNVGVFKGELKDAGLFKVTEIYPAIYR